MLKAIELKKTEPTFQRGKFLLVAHNLHNADEAYQAEVDFINKRHKELKQHQLEIIKEMLESVEETMYVNDIQA